jgi:hypothetical protein
MENKAIQIEPKAATKM